MAKHQRLTVGWGALSVGAFGGLLCSLALVACTGSDDSGGDSETGTGGSGGSTAETGGSTSGSGGDVTDMGGSGGSSSGEATFACMYEDTSTCLAYAGAESTIATIREAGTCEANGGTEVDECSPDGAAICVASSEGKPTTNSTYTYGLTAEEAESYRAPCEAAQGTFTPPAL